MDIVEAIRDNAEKGAKQLESEYRAGLMTLALRICRDPGDAAELVNRTFAEVVANIDNYAEQSAFFSWMSKILVNLHAKDTRRKSNCMEVYPGELPDVADEGAQEAVFRHLDASLLRDAIDTLPPDIRKTLLMHYFMDFSVKDVARMLAVPAGTVMWRLHYARQILAAKLGAAAKRPGCKALLLALALCGLTAFGAAVWSLPLVGGVRSVAAAAAAREDTRPPIGGNRQSAADSQNPESAAGLVPSYSPDSSDFQVQLVPSSTQETKAMNLTQTTRAAAIAASALAFASAPAAGYTTAIADTAEYVVLSASDTGTQSSIANGAHFPGGAPVGTKDYLVNNGLDIRTSSTANANTTFGGRSLTLDGGARVVLKGRSSKTTISDFRLYNSRLHHGEASSAVTIAGGMTVYATSANPVFVQGAGGRSLTLESNITGASGTRIKVESSGDAHSGTNPFFLNLKGNNSGYAGSFEVAGERFALVGYTGNAFASSPSITLTDGGRLLSGGESTIALSSAAITLSGGGVFGVYTKTGSNIGLQIGSGSISGTGTLTIDNAGTEGTHDRRVALGNVSIAGIDGIVANNTLQLASGYNNASIPITVTQPRMLRLTSGVKAGPVTLQAGANAESSDENVSLASLTLETTAAGTPFIRKYLHKGLVTITGDITNNLAAGEKIRIDFTVTAISQLANAQSLSFRVLSAANLGDAGVTADDFVATYDNDNMVAALRPYVLNGTFSIETDGGVKYLVYTLTSKAVYSTGADASGTSSFNTGTRWNDGAAPHNDAEYFIQKGHEIRSVNGASAEFKGKALNVLEGGKFSVIGSNKSGVTATIGDFRLSGGATLIAKSNWGNNLAGAITISGSPSNPAIYETEWANGSPEPSGRWLTIHSNISGNGSLLCRYLNQAATTHGAPVAGLNLRGDNTGFTGEWQIMHPAAKATFTSAANFGSASELVFNSNGVFRAQGGSFAITADVVVKNVGSVSGSEELTNGGTIEVDEGETLTVNGVVSGAGILRKTGAGTLLLNAENTLSGAVAVKQGLVGGTGSIGAVRLADGTGFAVSAAQSEPLEIGTLTLDGNIAVEIKDYVSGSSDRVALANVGEIVGDLPQTAVPATVNGRVKNNMTLSCSGGVLYAGLTSPLILVVR